MTPEELAEIEARSMNMCGEMHISHCAQILAQDVRALIAALKEAWAENERLKQQDSAAATHVESLICMRTHFTGEPPYVGWKGLGLALKEHLDAQDNRIVRAALVAAAKVALTTFPVWNERPSDLCKRIANAIRALPVPEDAGNMVLVPREPTPDMNIKGGIAISEALPDAVTLVDAAYACYRAMINTKE